ncbi:hypothetical protein WA026_008351, partial [Henosepilachna vigintioctopunctata]
TDPLQHNHYLRPFLLAAVFNQLTVRPASRQITMTDKNRDLLLVCFANNSFLERTSDTNRTMDHVSMLFAADRWCGSLLQGMADKNYYRGDSKRAINLMNPSVH